MKISVAILTVGSSFMLMHVRVVGHQKNLIKDQASTRAMLINLRS